MMPKPASTDATNITGTAAISATSVAALSTCASHWEWAKGNRSGEATAWLPLASQDAPQNGQPSASRSIRLPHFGHGPRANTATLFPQRLEFMLGQGHDVQRPRRIDQ